MNVYQELRNLVEPVKQTGPKRFAHWDAEAFEKLTHSYLDTFASNYYYKHTEHTLAIFQVYVQMLTEMVGRGYLRNRETIEELSEQNFMAHCFLYLAIYRLKQFDQGQQIPALVKLWNLCEGMLQEPSWIQHYIHAHSHQFNDIEDIEEMLELVLEPALAPTTNAHWQGPFSLSVFDTRDEEPSFLPGYMHLVAPTVLCVHDQRHEDTHLGIFLQPQGQNRCIGATPCLGETLHPMYAPPFLMERNAILINEQIVALDWMGDCANYAISDAGFFILTPAHSQRLWIIESP